MDKWNGKLDGKTNVTILESVAKYPKVWRYDIFLTKTRFLVEITSVEIANVEITGSKNKHTFDQICFIIQFYKHARHNWVTYFLDKNVTTPFLNYYQ